MADRSTKVTLTAQVQGYLDGMEKAAKATRETGSEAEKLAQKTAAFETLGRGAIVAGGAMAVGLGIAAKAAIDWESAWAGVTKTVDGTPEQLASIEQGLRDMTAVLPASHAELAMVAEAAGQLGIETPNILAFTKTMVDLGETTNLTSDQAATSLARFMNVMGTSQEKVSNLGSALVDLGNNYATTEAEILEMAQRLAGAGVQIGLSEGQVLGLATSLSSVGIEAEAGGSAMSKVMIDIASSVDKGGDRLAMFAKVSGVSADSFAAKWKSDPGAALAMFVSGLANAEAQGTSTLGVLEDLGITEVRMRDALLRSASAADEFAGAMGAGNKAFDENNALTAEAEKRYATTAAQLTMMTNSVVDAAISIGETFLPALEAGADSISNLADFIGGLPEPMIATVGWIGAIGAAVLLTSGVMMTAIPQVAKYRAALDDLNLSGGRLDKVMRGVGKAAGFAAAVGVIIALSREASVDVTELANSIERSAGATESLSNAAKASANAGWGELTAGLRETKVSADAVTEALAYAQERAEKGIFTSGRVNQGDLLSTISALKVMGDELSKLAGSDLPKMQSQLSGLADQFSWTDAEMWSFIENSPDLKKALEESAASMNLTTDKADLLKIAFGKVGPAASESGDEAKSSADQYVEAADAANELSGKLMSLLDSYNELNGIGQNAEQTNAALQSSFEGLQEYVANAQAGMEGYALSLDEGTAAGAANRAMLADHAGSVLANAQAQFELESATLGSEQAAANYEQRLSTGRQQIYDTALALTGNADAAQKLTDKVLAMPTAREVKILMETASAQAAIDNFIAANASKRINIAVGAGGTGGQVVGNANGGVYENGVKAFASGGFEPGIYPYTSGGIHKFAEEYGEAYISMDPARKQRSVGVWQEAGERLGVMQQIRDALGSARGGGAADVKQYNNVTMLERDPRLLMRQFGRELKGVIQ